MGGTTAFLLLTLHRGSVMVVTGTSGVTTALGAITVRRASPWHGIDFNFRKDREEGLAHLSPAVSTVPADQPTTPR
jgi:hypothetical protein